MGHAVLSLIADLVKSKRLAADWQAMAEVADSFLGIVGDCCVPMKCQRMGE